MGILTRMFEERTSPAANVDWGGYFGRGIETASGVAVTNMNSLQTAAVYACSRILSESVASLPLILYRRRRGRGRDRAADHPLYPILHDLANSEMTAYELRETQMGHVTIWGNGYAEIEFNQGGNVTGLWPLWPDKMKVTRRNGRIIYVYRMPEGSSALPWVELPFERVLHIRGLGYDGLVGYDPISLARQSIGLARATEEFGARFFGNGAQTGTVYQHPGKISPEAYDRLSKSIEKRHQGLENAHRIAILEEGMEAKQTSIPPENAQFLETRKFQIAEIARWFRVPPHMIADLDRATFSNIEHMSLEFVTYSLTPWLVRWEKAIYRDLLLPRERQQGLFAEHLLNALVRGDIKTRYEAYNIGRNGGWLSANDIREMENQNPIEGEGGDIYLVPLNMVPVEQVMEPLEPVSDSDEGQRSLADNDGRGATYESRAKNLAKGRVRMATSYERVLRDTARRVIKREIADVRRAVRKYLGQRSVEEFTQWLQDFYREHKSFWARQMLPVLLAYADQAGISVADELGGEPGTADDIREFIDEYVTALSGRESNSSQLQLQALLEEAVQAGEDPEPALTRRLDEWEEKRAKKTANHESRNALNAFATAFYILRRVTRLVWRTVGDSCPYCSALEGRTIDIQGQFLDKDEEFQPDGAEAPLSKRHKVKHGPLHDGCDCQVMAG